MLIMGIFWKITTYWPPLDEVFIRTLQKVAKLGHYLQSLINFHGFYVQKIIHYIENKNGL